MDNVGSNSPPRLTLADVAVELSLEARWHRSALDALAVQVMPAELSKLRQLSMDAHVRRAHAVAVAAEIMRGLSKLPPSILISLGALDIGVVDE